MSGWNDCCEYGKPSVKQIGSLRKLKLVGLYRGMNLNPSEEGDDRLNP